MNVTIIDGIATVAFANGVLRVECVAAGPNNEQRPSGTLLIPGSQVGSVLQALINATQELQRRQREQDQQQQQQ